MQFNRCEHFGLHDAGSLTKQQATTPLWKKMQSASDVVIGVQADPFDLVASLREYVADVLCAEIEDRQSVGYVMKATLCANDVPLCVEFSVIGTGPMSVVFIKHLSRSDSVGFHGACTRAVSFLSSMGWRVLAPEWLRPSWELLPLDEEHLYDDDLS